MRFFLRLTTGLFIAGILIFAIAMLFGPERFQRTAREGAARSDTQIEDVSRSEGPPLRVFREERVDRQTPDESGRGDPERTAPEQ